MGGVQIEVILYKRPQRLRLRVKFYFSWSDDIIELVKAWKLD